MDSISEKKDTIKLEDEIGFDEIENLSDIYSNSSIQISRDQYSINEIYDYVKTGDFILSPDFQRNYVWKPKQKCELIESVLMGLPLPIIYLFELKSGKKQVIDGKQRITTLISFLKNEFKLEKLKILPQFNNLMFKDLEARIQSKFRRFQLSVMVIEPPTPERVKLDIFMRVNRGGTILNNQEIRNVMFNGKSTEFLNELSKYEIFIKATDNSVSPKFKKDEYLILRFISFYMLYNNMLNYSYHGDSEDFFAFTMKYLNSCPESVLINLKKTFKEVTERFYYIMGEDGFRYESKEGSKKRPINMLLFETLAYIFSQLPSNMNESEIKRKTVELKKEMDSLTNLRNGADSKPNVDLRFVTLLNRWREI